MAYIGRVELPGIEEREPLPMIRLVRWVLARPRSWFINTFGCEPGQAEGTRQYLLLWLNNYQYPVHSYAEMTDLFKQAVEERHDQLEVWV